MESNQMRGVIYSSVGAPYLRECIESAKTVRRWHPELAIEIYGDQPPRGIPGWAKFNQLPAGLHVSEIKAIAMRMTSIEEGLYLDSDTVIKGRLDEIWSGLKKHDLILANESGPDDQSYKNFFHYNSGVIGFKKSKNFHLFLDAWIAEMRSFPLDQRGIAQPGNDQECINKIIFIDKLCQSLDLKLLLVDNLIYNARGGLFKQMKKDGIYKKAKILHCHSVHFHGFALLRFKMRGVKKALFSFLK